MVSERCHNRQVCCAPGGGRPSLTLSLSRPLPFSLSRFLSHSLSLSLSRSLALALALSISISLSPSLTFVFLSRSLSLYLYQWCLNAAIIGRCGARPGERAPRHGAAGSGDTTPCMMTGVTIHSHVHYKPARKVTPVILHGTAPPDGVSSVGRGV